MNLLTNLSFQMLYADPAAVSILLTSITAIVLAIGASAIIIWRKLKTNVQKTFKIDPTSGKEVEEDIVITEDSDGENTDKENVKCQDQTEQTIKDGKDEEVNSKDNQI